MNDVVIRKCTLRIVRHGGWSWGSNRRALLEQATSALPRLIAERLAELLPDGEGEIVEPIRLRFSLPARQLASGEDLAQIIGAGIRPEVLPLLLRVGAQAAGNAQSRDATDKASDAPTAATPRNDLLPQTPLLTPTQVLQRWRSQGELWQRLQGFSTHALELWLAALLVELPVAPAELAPPEILRRECAVIQRALPVANDGSSRTALARLALAVELVSRHEGALAADALIELLDDVVPLSASPVANDSDATRSDGEARHPRDSLDTDIAASGIVRAAVPAPKKAVAPPAREVKLCSVLPYIVLGVLHRLGWLDMASATFRALRDPDNGSAFATALAYKLLPAPDRGWRRTDEVLRTAAAFAGVAAPASPAELGSWSRQAAGGLSPLDDFVVSEIARGHDLGLPLLIMRVESRYDREWLLFDADGGLPVAWARDEAEVRRNVRRFGPCVILVSTGAASRSLMQGLAKDERTFVTTAMPTRNDEWQRIRGTPCWASGAQTTSRRLLDAAALLPEIEAQALSVTRDLLQLRPVAVPRDGAELEHSAALAAATGLGALAWILWNKRETVHPLLALQRFGNLDGTARATPTAVEVRPAFGRRFLDLRKGGLLADIPAPPWLGGRRIVFAGP